MEFEKFQSQNIKWTEEEGQGDNSWATVKKRGNKRSYKKNTKEEGKRRQVGERLEKRLKKNRGPERQKEGKK